MIQSQLRFQQVERLDAVNSSNLSDVRDGVTSDTKSLSPVSSYTTLSDAESLEREKQNAVDVQQNRIVRYRDFLIAVVLAAMTGLMK